MLDISKLILYEDNHILVCVKPAGLGSQGDASGDIPLTDTVKKYLKIKYNKPNNVYLGLVHRLDRPVSGIMVLAKTSKAAARLTKQFNDRQIKKYYLAMVNGPANEEAKLKNYLIRQEKKCLIVNEGQDGKIALLEYRKISNIQNEDLLLINLLTGRHHQIRCQLAFQGLNIVGDTLYGSRINFNKGKIALHACALSFIHPVKKIKMEFYNIPELWPVLYRDLFTERTEESLKKNLNFV